MKYVDQYDMAELEAEMRHAKPEDPINYCQHVEFHWPSRSKVRCYVPITRVQTYCQRHRGLTRRERM